MKLGIMQPYFFPYIGYWQLIHAVDQFVVYDNIQYTKKGWINRNRILMEGRDKVITLPLKKDSDFLDVRERRIAQQFASEKKKLLSQIAAAYKKAPQYEQIFPLVRECIEYEEDNLFRFLYHSIVKLMDYMGIETEVIISSTVDADAGLRKEERVKALCKALGAEEYRANVRRLLELPFEHVLCSHQPHLYERKTFESFVTGLTDECLRSARKVEMGHPADTREASPAEGQIFVFDWNKIKPFQKES